MKMVLEITDDEVMNDFCAQHGYQETIIQYGLDDEESKPKANPESKQEFMERILGEIVENAVNTYRVNKAVENARQTAAASPFKLEKKGKSK